MVRVIYLVHESPGRLRLRLPYLRHAPDAVDPLADHLAGLQGMEEVQIKPYTGSVLCTFDRHQLRSSDILAAAQERTGIATVLQPGERSLAEEEALAQAALHHGSDLARAAACFFKSMNLEVLRASGGRIDLGTLAAATFATAGAAEVVATGKLPLPPWFNLGWWAFRTFTSMEKNAIDAAPVTPTQDEVHAG
ncbi:HMA2 domain-containing protein [Vulgatibacter sp.]|uniref:HMA2 domain-containing protein n=1 Tax=Vulgatibacter sp. TaxID=1971226 RepID=UPI0035670B96